MKAWNRKTNEQFISDLKDKGIKILPLKEYVDSHTKILFKCNVCGNKWSANPTNILSGRGCPICKRNKISKKLMMGQEEFVKMLSVKNPNIEVLGKYKGDNKTVKVKCKKHNIIWEPIATALKRGCGCSVCLREKISEKNGISHEEFVEKIHMINTHIDILSKYKNAKTMIDCRCKIHNVKYSVVADFLVNGYGSCPKCTMSSGEMKVSLILDKMNIRYIQEYSFKSDEKVKNKRYDFYIPEKNTCIEYDGAQHFRPLEIFGGVATFELGKISDKLKDDYCKRNNINLIRIPYTINDIETYLQERLA